jgi:hypothetical protein
MVAASVPAFVAAGVENDDVGANPVIESGKDGVVVGHLAGEVGGAVEPDVDRQQVRRSICTP